MQKPRNSPLFRFTFIESFVKTISYFLLHTKGCPKVAKKDIGKLPHKKNAQCLHPRTRGKRHCALTH